MYVNRKTEDESKLFSDQLGSFSYSLC
jgi:hypothetical protein